MPYIADDRRPHFDHEVDELIAALGAMGWNEGDLNYVLSRIIGAAFEAEMRYHTCPRVRGVLGDVCAEFYRRIIVDYEDGAIEKNGDIPEYARLSEKIAANRLNAALDDKLTRAMDALNITPEEKK
jgi:hypothetical protein